MAKRKNIRTAGRLVTGVIYTVSRDRDTEQERSAKTNISSQAREVMNLRLSWQKLEQVLAANFKYSDLHITLTYKDVPCCRSDAVKILKKFIRSLREARREETGEVLLYIYVTEGNHGDKRIHHHMVINGTINDFEMIRRLWPYGNVRFNTVGAVGYTKLAQYLTKEPRDGSRWVVGERTWTPAKGLLHPKPDKGWVPDNFSLTAPPGATIIMRETVQNSYGVFDYLKYLLPDKPVDLPKEYHRPRPQRKTDRI